MGLATGRIPFRFLSSLFLYLCGTEESCCEVTHSPQRGRNVAYTVRPSLARDVYTSVTKKTFSTTVSDESHLWDIQTRLLIRADLSCCLPLCPSLYPEDILLSSPPRASTGEGQTGDDVANLHLDALYRNTQSAHLILETRAPVHGGGPGAQLLCHVGERPCDGDVEPVVGRRGATAITITIRRRRRRCVQRRLAELCD